MGLRTGSDVAIAFGLTFVGAAATLLGGVAIISPTLLHKLGDNRVLAFSMALAAGVMIYVSFVDVLPEAHHHFILAGVSEANSWLFTNLSFFGGIVFAFLLELFTDWLWPMPKVLTGEEVCNAASQCSGIIVSGTPAADTSETAEVFTQVDVSAHVLSVGTVTAAEGKKDKAAKDEKKKKNKEARRSRAVSVTALDTASTEATEKRLKRSGLLTMFILTLHNLPEGLATFTGTLSSVHFGAGLAVAVAMHNIPEGLAVAVPMYYATHSRLKAMMYVGVSALAEPLAALLAWLVLADHLNDIAFGVMFGATGGMMAMVALQELLPNAFRNDPSGSVVSVALVVGMFIMAASIVAFSYVE